MTQLFCVVFSLLILGVTAYPRLNDPQYMNFIRDWSAHCMEKTLPSYHWKELAPATRKCDTERCVYLIYDYIAKYLPEYYADYDVCYEKNTKILKKITK